MELYNLSSDPNEKINVAAKNPEIIQKMSEIFQREHTPAEIERFKIPLIEKGLTNQKE